jgi:DNA-binding transcriptional LysR family regulator
MRVAEMPDSLDALRTGDLDLSVIIDAVKTPLELPGDVEVADLFDDPFLATLPYSHPLAGRGAIALADLREEEWMVTGVGNSCPDTTIVLDACREAGFTPQASFSSDDYAAIQGMVASGMGVAIIPSLALGNARDDIAIRPLRGTSPMRRVRAAVAADRPSALADALLEILRASGRDRRWAGRQLAAVA